MSCMVCVFELNDDCVVESGRHMHTACKGSRHYFCMLVAFALQLKGVKGLTVLYYSEGLF